jgi:hypothetical protein
MRHNSRLGLLGSPFDALAHTVDVRRINSQLRGSPETDGESS